MFQLSGFYLDSQVARNYRTLYPKLDRFKVAHNYEPLALQVLRYGLAGSSMAFWGA